MQLALYRECRPRTFSEIVGQEHVTRTLLNAIRQGRLTHAYLFCGPRGTGKTTTARILAKALNCRDQVNGQPCGTCRVCEGIARGEGIDVIEMDAASNRGVDEIRGLRERVRLAPVSGTHKVYVIDEVHMLTNEAFNALLKTLEEPPGNVVFVLCTTEAYRVPSTILSRCQRFDFHRLPTVDIAAYLGTVAADRGWDVAAPALRAIARAASGSMRDALSILDQCIAYSDGGVSLELVRRVLGAVDPQTFAELAEGMLSGDLAQAWSALDKLVAQGRDPREVARALANHYRDLLLYRLAGRAGEPNGPLADDWDTVAHHAGLASEKALYEGTDALVAAESEMRLAAQPRLLLEARLTRICGVQLQAESQQAEPRRGIKPALPDSSPPQAAAPSRAQALDPGTASRATTMAPAPPPVNRGTRRVAAGGGERRDADASPFDSDQTRSGFDAALAQLSDKDRGLLDGAVPGWDGRRFCVWLPEDREAMAEFLNGGAVCQALAEALGKYFGCELEVRIRARLRAPGLFDEPPAKSPAERRGSTRASRAQTPDAKGAGAAGAREGKSEMDDDDAALREARDMFRAEDVSKGVT